MFYLINNGGKYADIGFGDVNEAPGIVIGIINGEYTGEYNYEITEDGYKEVPRPEPITTIITENDLGPI